MSSQDSLRLVGYCGLYCGLCAQRSRIPREARQLQNSLHEEGFDDWYRYFPDIKEAFPPFWQFLRWLVELHCACRADGRPPDCQMRRCARERRIDVCTQCSDYPCAHIAGLAERYPTMIQDGKHLQKVGLETWIKEQQERAKRGVIYADIRIPRT